MEKERLFSSVLESPDAPVHSHFPIVKDEGIYHINLDNIPDTLKDGEIVTYTLSLQWKNATEESRKYIMVKEIAGLHYVFFLGQSIDNHSQFLFKTKEYGYAITNLDEQSTNELYSTISSFIESIHAENNNLSIIDISPADQSYSAKEYQSCLEEILSSPLNKLDRENLKYTYKGAQLFDYYQRIYKKEYPLKHDHWEARSFGRARLFQRMVKKYMPNWEIVLGYPGSSEFSIKRKS